MLAGAPPFTGLEMAVVFKHLREPPPPLEGVSRALEEVLVRALAKDPSGRFQTAAEMRQALRDPARLASRPADQGAKERPRRMGRLVVGVALTIILAAVGAAFLVGG